jgi:hypothetical protein
MQASGDSNTSREQEELRTIIAIVKRPIPRDKGLWKSMQASGQRGAAMNGSGFTRLLLRQRFGNRLLQPLTTQILADNGTLAIEEVSGRDAVDAVFHGQLVLPL